MFIIVFSFLLILNLLYIVLAYLMLFGALFNSICLHNAYLFLFVINLCIVIIYTMFFISMVCLWVIDT